MDYNERSAYPHPDDFKVMRPEYVEVPEEDTVQAIITIAPFNVSGRSATKPGARRAALYEAEKVYKQYHPSYSINIPYPVSFTDQENKTWKRLPPSQRGSLGDFEFEDEDGSDYTDIETMLLWDVRVQDEEE